jgi:CheY-like chemotaxis protein/signal transduction histidine kinase/HAMP domain-containing protein
MRLSFRGALMAIVGVAAAALVLVTAASSIIERRVERQLASIRERHLPRLELGPRLENQFDRLRRAFQDAAVANDLDALGETRALEKGLLQEIDNARGIIDPGQAASLRAATEDYYGDAAKVTRASIAGETGEALVEAMSAMQRKHGRVADLLQALALSDRRELTAAFAAATDAQVAAARARLLLSIPCLIVALLLSLRLSRGALRSLSELAAGLQRFGSGDFSQAITTEGKDELGVVATEANQMAQRLLRLGIERDRADWLKGAVAGMARELRGELEPREAATRGLRFLAPYVDARAGALYYVPEKGHDPGDDGSFVLLGHYALSPPPSGREPGSRFASGEGVVGQAALREDITVVTDPPPDYLRIRSGLGEGAPRAIVLMPLTHLGMVRGVLELALFTPWSELASEALLSVRETLVIAIEVARARTATRELLVESQRQAQRLANQEEELRAVNEEMHAQQEELQQTNTELAAQTEELEAQRRDLEEKNRDLDDASRRLEQKAGELATVSAYKSQFLTNMSHELRTPLNSMLLLSNLLGENETGNLSDKQVEFARTIHAAGKDLLALINQVLDLAKVESGKQEITLGPVVLVEMIGHLQRVFAPLAADKGLTLTADVDTGLPATIVSDRQRLDQILTNLLANAIKFTERGHVSLHVGPAAAVGGEACVAFTVSDTGVGIAPEDQQRVFAPFEQVDAAPDRRYGGTGLGLSISRELAVLLGGELVLKSTRGQGSTFTCTLPAAGPAQGSVEESAKGSAARAGRPRGSRSDAPIIGGAAGRGGSRRKVRGDLPLLVIEDDPKFAEAFGEVIRRQGLEYVVASDGQTGLRLARERQPDGIILDVSLPDLDGWKVLEALRADPATADIPVHFLTASDEAERGMALGAVGYLTKPATRADLVGVLGSLIPRRAEHKHRVLVVEDDAAIGDSLAKRLASEGYEVLRASSAREAFQAVSEERFTCMILDLSLPDMDGLELLSTLRDMRDVETPPVVVYTGRALSRAEARMLESYTEAVVLKDGPSAERLLDEVRLFVSRLREGGGERRQQAGAAPAPDVRLGGKRILVADDDMRTVYALSAMLVARGAEVLVADTGREALTVLEAHPEVDVVLMDVMMPEMDGYEAMRRIRAQPRFASLPVIALTAKAMKGDRERCLEVGASDYLPKPIDADRLLAVLAAQLAGPEELAGPTKNDGGA